MDVTVAANKAGRFTMRLRVPGWAQGTPLPSDLYSYATPAIGQGFTVMINGTPEEAVVDNGYITLDRKWRKGDRVSLQFDMTPRLVTAHDKVTADRGMVAVERGPLVYCAEWCDNEADLSSLMMNLHPNFRVSPTDKLNGVRQISADVQCVTLGDDGMVTSRRGSVNLIPYYAWANRGEGKMKVWFPATLSSFGRGQSAEAEKNEFED